MPGIVEVDFLIRERVYHVTGGEDVGIVTGINVREGSVIYAVTWPNRNETGHYAFELSRTPCYAGAND